MSSNRSLSGPHCQLRLDHHLTIDLTGLVLNCVEVLGYSHSLKEYHFWRVLCRPCQSVIIFSGYEIREGKLFSCGCSESVPFLIFPDPDVEYRQHPRFPRYFIGSDGSVWTPYLFNRRGIKCFTTKWRRIGRNPNPRGYFKVNLQSETGEGHCFIHNLVLEAFVGPCPDGMECCHNDGNPSNNHLDNLRWDTHTANVRDALRHGVMAVGSRAVSAKLTEEDIPIIRELLAQKVPHREIGRRFGVDKSQITRIATGKRWKHVR